MLIMGCVIKHLGTIFTLHEFDINVYKESWFLIFQIKPLIISKNTYMCL